MKAPAPSRRDFLSTTSLVAVGLATGGSMILAPDFAWALSTKAIDAHAAVHREGSRNQRRALHPVGDQKNRQYAANPSAVVGQQIAALESKLLFDGALP